MKHSQSQRAHAKLKTIGPELLHEVDEKLKFGKSSHEVTAYLHENGALTDVKADSLRKMLDRYRQTELRDKTIAALTQAQRKDTLVTAVKRLHAIDELEELARVQHARVTKVMATESKAPLLIAQVGNEITRLHSLLSDLARLQLETGLIQRAPKKVFGTMTTPDGKPHEFVWTEEFDKLNEELQEFEHRVAHEAASDPIDALRAAFVILQGIGGHAEHVWECSKLYEEFAERLAYLARSIAWLKAKVNEKTWRVPPVDFETFCNAPHLLNKNGSLWQAVLAEGRKLNNGQYVEALLTGGIGVGKTHLAIYTQAYQVYLMSCMVSTHEPFGLDPASDIVTVFQSINKNLALSVDYRAFRTIISESPYFAKEFPFDDSRESEMRFPRHIVVKPVSGSDTAAIGQNVIGGIMDEVNFMAVVEDSKMTRDGSVYDQATSNYTSIARRRESRFMVMGQLPGMLCLVSSRNYPGQFSDVVEERAKKDPRIFVYDKRQWEVRPERFSGETFRVFVGDQSRNPRILEDSDPVVPQDERLVWAVPVEFKSKFEDGLMGAVRDILGLSTLALFPFMTNADPIAKCFGKVQPICSLEGCDFVTSRPMIYPKRMEHPEEPRFCHIDLAKTKDSAGVSIGHVPRFTQFVRGEYKELLPIIQFDLILEVFPPRGGEIEYAKIRELIYLLRNKLNMPIKWVTFDQYQSTDSQQIMQREGFATGHMSMDTDTMPYEMTKLAFYDGRILAPPHKKALREMLGLEFDPKHQKIDHPPHGSKDVSDSMAGVVIGLMKQRLTWVRHRIPTNAIPSYLLQNKGKNDVEKRKERFDKLSYINRVRAEKGLIELEEA